MATESILKNFIISNPKDVEMFANAVEESYQESLTRPPRERSNIKFVKGNEAMDLVLAIIERNKELREKDEK